MGDKFTLRVEVGASRGRVFVLDQDEPFYVGRDKKCDYQIASTRVSRLHCKFVGRRGSFCVEDLDSRQGTYVNGERVKSRALRSGDVVMVSGNRLRFEVGDPDRIGMASYGAATSGEKGGSADAAASEKPPVARAEPEKATEGEAEGGFQVVAPSPAPSRDDEGETVLLRVVEPDWELGVFVFTARDRELMGRSFGPCRLIEPAGRGRRCVIFKSEHQETGRIVAVKLLRPTYRKNVSVKRWFVKGAQRAGKARHENVVRIISGGREGDDMYLVMEFMPCNAFQRFRKVKEEGLEGVRRALQTVTQVTRALEFGYSEQRILHGGVRPSKILFNDAGRAKLTGLGFNNKTTGPKAPGGEDLAPYLAPEMLEDPGKVRRRTDIYALGASFYYMLTGDAPQRDAGNHAPSPKERNAQVPDSIVRITEKMLAPSAAGRYENYAHLLHDLRWALRGEVWHRG